MLISYISPAAADGGDQVFVLVQESILATTTSYCIVKGKEGYDGDAVSKISDSHRPVRNYFTVPTSHFLVVDPQHFAYLLPTMESSLSVAKLLLRRQNSNVEPIPVEDAISFIYGYRINTYSGIADTVCIFYSIVTTLDRESRTIWTNPLQVSSIVFFVNRYMSLLASLISIWYFTYHATMDLCNTSLWGYKVLIHLTVLSGEYILTLRVLALYSQSKRLAIALYTLFGIESALVLFCFVYILVKKQVAVGGVDGYAFCGFDNVVSPAIQMISWISVLTYESILLFLALYQSTIIYKETGRRFRSTELVMVLIKDQILYFIAVMVPAITSIIYLWLSPNQDDAVIVVINVFISPSIPCIIGSLIMFNLREAAQRGVNGGTNISLNVRTESSMVFT